MTNSTRPLEVYRRFQSMLLHGKFGELGEVADVDGYTENCVGLTGWTTGLQAALRNFQQGVASALTDMQMTEEDLVESDDTEILRFSLRVLPPGFVGQVLWLRDGRLRRAE